MMKNIDMLIVGVGGQGTLLLSRIMGHWALGQGYDVKVSEVHGMAQRGGSVVTHVRMAPKVYSPLVEQADVLLAFELLEALRWRPFLKEDGVLIVNAQEILPMPVITGAAQYPADAQAQLSDAVLIDAQAIAEKLGNGRAMNCVLLGVMAGKLGLPTEPWLEAVAACVPPKTVELNQKAFMQGYGHEQAEE